MKRLEKREKRLAKSRITTGTENESQSESEEEHSYGLCPVYRRCGGCQLQGVSYPEQIKKKEVKVRELLGEFGKIEPMITMENPYHYRNKVHAVFDIKNGKILSGVYEEGTHDVVNVDFCQIEDKKAGEIIRDIRGLLKSFKIKTYDEDTGYGLLRHVLVRTGFQTGEIMVVLVLGSPILPSKNNFVKALRELHPEISTVVVNVNNRQTSMVLGDKETTIYGKGYIEDILMGLRFRISAKSFYQVNPVQTEKLYQIAMDYANLTGSERVLDTYCGIGTIGMVAAKHAKEVIGVELNRDAVRDAVVNAKLNQVENIRFIQDDAGEFMKKMAAMPEEMVDVVFMDPPRSGCSEDFLTAVTFLAPERIVYISCNPVSLQEDLDFLVEEGYEVKKIQPVDMFPFTNHVETLVALHRKDT